jgi:hypothetical protein
VVYSVREAEPLESRQGQDNRVELAPVELREARRHVPADPDQDEVASQGGEA